MKSIVFFGILLFFLLCNSRAYCADFSALKGINLDQSLESASKWKVSPTQDELNLIKALGFNAIRLPIAISNHLDGSGQRISEAYLSRLKGVVSDARSLGFFVIVDLHDKEIAKSIGNHSSDLLVGIWKQIAIKLGGVKDGVAFEILNEPFSASTPQKWSSIQNSVVDEIRKIDPNRPLILTGSKWGEIESLAKIVPSSHKKNIYYTIHYYSPMWFTHQGANWIKDSDRNIGRAWVSNKDNLHRLASDFAEVANWGKANDYSLILGEFGVIDKVPELDRAEWAYSVRVEAEARNVGWFYWSFKGDFGIIDIKKACLRRVLVRALTGVDKQPPVGYIYCDR